MSKRRRCRREPAHSNTANRGSYDRFGRWLSGGVYIELGSLWKAPEWIVNEHCFHSGLDGKYKKKREKVKNIADIFTYKMNQEKCLNCSFCPSLIQKSFMHVEKCFLPECTYMSYPCRPHNIICAICNFLLRTSMCQKKRCIIITNPLFSPNPKNAICYVLYYFANLWQALTLDCGNHWPGGPVNQKIHWPPKKPTGPPKTCNDPNVFAAGIYDFTREFAHFCTLGLYNYNEK